MFGSADNTTGYVNLSDGGHFENLGIYELVRRRCRYIIAVDAEQDGDMRFNGLANAVRKCRTDFGVNIDIDLSEIRRSPSRSRAHCTVGTIDYGEPQTGYLLYVKSSLTADEPADVQEYADQEPKFPHESTSDQWFDEAQFESYRMLGYHAARDALSLAVKSVGRGSPSRSPDDGPVVENAADRAGSSPPGLPLTALARVFEHLRQLWAPLAPHQPGDITRHAQTYSELFERVRKGPRMDFLDPVLFKTLPRYAGPLPLNADRDTLYIGHALIEFMHRVFVDLNLDRFKESPHNQGWVRIFEAWKAKPELGVAWKAVRDSYSLRFQVFYDSLSAPNGENAVPVQRQEARILAVLKRWLQRSHVIPRPQSFSGLRR
jgi:hypothetical protein